MFTDFVCCGSLGAAATADARASSDDGNVFFFYRVGFCLCVLIALFCLSFALSLSLSGRGCIFRPLCARESTALEVLEVYGDIIRTVCFRAC